MTKRLLSRLKQICIFAPMANRLKSKKSQAPVEEKLKPEKEAQVTVKQIVRDERTHKITGAVFLLLAVFLFIAFTSYLFTWKEDQDKVFHGASILLPSSTVKVTNLLGNLGALIAHQFFFNGFGLASYLFCSFFFIIGINLLFAKKIFSINRNLRYVLAGLLFFSVFFGFITRGSSFPFGGALGTMVSDKLILLLGKVGTLALLLVAGLAYFIWRFNPVFHMPNFAAARDKAVAPVAVGDLENDEDGSGDEEIVEQGAGAKLFVDERVAKTKGKGKGNSMKGKGALANVPPVIEPDPEPAIDFTVIERDPAPDELQDTEEEEDISPFEEDELTLHEPDEISAGLIPPVTPVTPTPPIIPATDKPRNLPRSADLELEIKSSPLAEEPEEIIPEKTRAELDSDEAEAAAALSLPDYEPTLDLRDYKYPSLDLLEAHGSEKIIQDAAELEANKNQIINTLKNYDIAIQKISATVGPTVTLYEIVPAAGVRISRIKNLEDDIALSLAALGIRIIAPIPGKGTIGIEVPNVKKTVVSMRTLLSSEKFQNSNFSLPIAIGKKIDNENFIVDLAAMPHLLMAGATGQGKSVGLNAILVSLLYKKHPSQLKLVLVDPKKVELSIYRTIEKHFLAKLPGEEEAIITDTKKVVHTLNALCIEMDNRYDLLKEANARNIREYNEKFIKRRLNPQKGHQYLPFIVLVVDEFADLIMTAGKEVEMPIARLAQLARAVGIHLIIATQRPSVNIITGTIKANFPARIGFKVSSKIDSRTILDAGGAEQLIGKGDMLISYNGEITRLQCAFVDTPEVEEITEFIGAQRGYPQAFMLPEYLDEKDMEGKDFDLGDRDPLFEDAARLIVQNQIGSTSLLQRRMKLGYNRAGRLMDQLEAAGVVGPGLGSKARDVLIKTEHELEQYLNP